MSILEDLIWRVMARHWENDMPVIDALEYVLGRAAAEQLAWQWFHQFPDDIILVDLMEDEDV